MKCPKCDEEMYQRQNDYTKLSYCVNKECILYYVVREKPKSIEVII